MSVGIAIGIVTNAAAPPRIRAMKRTETSCKLAMRERGSTAVGSVVSRVVATINIRPSARSNAVSSV